MTETKLYISGNPVNTEAVTAEVPVQPGLPELGNAHLDNGRIILDFDLQPDTLVYGLGESPRGMNKRGWEYISNAADDPEQTEERRSLYAAHNFLIVMDPDQKPFGLFVDQPDQVRFDIGYTRQDRMRIEIPDDMKLYVISGDTPEEIVREFRSLIGQSYIPPKYAFGYAQSRWGYKTKADYRGVADRLKENNIPLDILNMDIDYMDNYKDFTLNAEEFSDFPAFVQEFKDRNIHLVPIIDAGVKLEEGYSVCDEGIKNGYFCKLEDQSTDFVGAVWPGFALFPDFLNTRSRQWFGKQYHVLTDMGIDGFWNDMNEPALFYSKQGRDELVEYLKEYIADPDAHHIFELNGKVAGIKNSPEDYARFWHNMDGRWVRHDKVHNLYGYNMTRAAGEAFEELRPGLRTLMYSRSSYIGAHRYGGIWTGDNKAWWSHIPLLISQLPALNMAGFLYVGADLGGFGGDTTRDLTLRFTQLGVFTPLMRNHACLGTRDQEPYQFENPEDFAHVIGVRYRLLNYLYSEYLKAAAENKMMFRPLSFVYPEDEFARGVEDQLIVGDEIMIAPVYAQNAKGRYVYLPEEMKQVRFLPDGTIRETIMSPGHHYVEYPLNEVQFFIRKDRAIPITDAAMSVPEIDEDTLQMIGWPGAMYERWNDDGISSSSDSQSRTQLTADFQI